MTFWDVHGYFGGFFFILFLLLLPRLTLLLTVSFWAIISQVIVQQLGITGWTGWGITFVLSIVAWIAWLIFPRYVIAVAATVLYWNTNLVLCIFAWTIAYILFEATKAGVREAAKKMREKVEELRAERERVQEEIRKTEEAIRRMQKDAQRQGRSEQSVDELLENIRRFQEHVRQQQEQARRAGSMRNRAKHWSEVLGVSKDAPAEVIKAAYRKIAKVTHPDTAPDGKGDAKRFSEATEAYKAASKK